MFFIRDKSSKDDIIGRTKLALTEISDHGDSGIVDKIIKRFF